MHRLRDSAKTDADRALYGEVSEIYKEMSWLGRGPEPEPKLQHPSRAVRLVALTLGVG
jgi:hypothetical protein